MWPFTVKYDKSCAENLKLARIKISGATPNGRNLFCTQFTEKYTEHPNNSILNMGAFSYSHGFEGPVATHLLKIGRYCSIALGARIFPTNHPTDWISTHPFQYSKDRYADREFFDLPENFEQNNQNYKNLPSPVNIGHNVWIGIGVTIAGGITIGNGSIVAANSTVTKDVAPNTIVAGLPAKPIKLRLDPGIHRDLERLQWWNYHFKDLQGISFNEPAKAVNELEKRLASIEALTDIKVDLSTLKD